jgi:hypothetical protein
MMIVGRQFLKIMTDRRPVVGMIGQSSRQEPVVRSAVLRPQKK